MFIDNLFEVDLKRKPEKDLMKCTDDSRRLDELSLQVYVGQTFLTLPALLMERGFYSDNIYRARVNHRDLDNFVLRSHHSKGRPVRDSFCAPERHEDFDNVVLFPHSVKYLEAGQAPDDNLKMVTQCPCRLPEEFKAPDMRGAIEGMEVCRISNYAFKRLLALFGYRWVQVVDGARVDCKEDPNICDVMYFLQVVKGPVITTPEEFKKFLEKHRLDELFEYQANRDVVTNLYLFGRLLRSVVPIRFSPCEGQHRMWCLSSMIQGLPDATDQLPLKKKLFAEYEDYHCRNYDTWQIHQKKIAMLIEGSYSIVTGEQSLSMVVSKCRSYSDDKSQNQETFISWNVHGYAVKCAATAAAKFKDIGLEKVTRSTHWCVNSKSSLISANMHKLWDVISDDIESNATLRMQASLTGGQDVWPSRRDAMKEKAALEETRITPTTWAKTNRPLFVLFHLLKGLVSDPDSLGLLQKLARAEFS